MKLEIQPLVALCDEKVNICVSELPPQGKVKISAALVYPWAKTVKCESFAWFTADITGKVDLSVQKPDSGTYDYVDSMGLISSVQIASGDLNDVAQNISVDESLFIDFTAECGEDRATTRAERLFKTPEVKNLKITDEFVGELFYTENRDYKTIVLFGGSSGSLDANLPISATLASHGFNVLTVAYFHEKGLPANLSQIPLEYFEKVFDWVRKHPITGGNNIQLLGISKGGELVMLLASRYPFITKVAAMAPHAYCFQGIAFKNASSWTYHGKDLPYIRLKNTWLIADVLDCMVKNLPFGFTSTYRKGLNVAKNKEEARIKIENSNADLMLFATTQNNMWNTYDGCTQIMDTLRERNYQHKYDLVVYEDAGEPFYVPYVIPAGVTSTKLAPRLVLSMGGSLKGNTHTQVDSWKRTVQFFKN
ncbi:MAG TPA: acyl-CoA thioester hydrolase/BAAT C-terminal domain-containing protein [Methanocella sp.]|nr:acyl-CoA thioester hydrolase/BAAT C-terminal domain-containing protein [Methanocella sp.]